MALVNDEREVMMDLVTEMTEFVDSGDKYHFRKAATEALVSDRDVLTKTKVLTRLYNDIAAKSLIDFDEIPKSKGDFTKYKQYKLAVDTMETLNDIFKDGKKYEEVEMMNRLYDLLISLKPDFQYGYLHNIEFIKLQYNTLVLSFHEIQNICIMAYLKYVRDVKASSISFEDYRRKDLLVLKSIKQFIAMHDRGEWSAIMKSIKKGDINLNAMESATGALEFLNINISAGVGETGADGKSDAAPKTLLGIGRILDSTKDAYKGVKKDDPDEKKSKTFKKIFGVIAFIVMAYAGLRKAVYFFYNKAARVSDTLKLQLTFLEAVQSDPQAMNPKTAKLSKRLVDLANATVGVIDNKIFNGNAKAEKDMSVSTKALANDLENDFNSPSSSDDDFELM